MSVVARDEATTLVHAVGRLRLAELARRYHVDVDVIRAIRDEVREHDHAARKARRASRSRASEAATLAAALTRQIGALEKRLDPEDPGELAALVELAESVERLRLAQIARLVDSGASYAEIGRAIPPGSPPGRRPAHRLTRAGP